MVLRKVLVIENNLVLGACIESLLALDPDLHVIGIAPQNEAALIQAIWRAQPDVLIMDEESRLTNPMRLLCQLENYPKLRLIVVNRHNNWLQLFDIQVLHANWASAALIPVSTSRVRSWLPAQAPERHDMI